MRVLGEKLHCRAALGPRLTHHRGDVGAPRRRLVVVDECIASPDRAYAHLAQAETEFEIFPSVLAKALVEAAGLAHEVKWQRHVRRPEKRTRIVAPRIARRR